MPNAPQREAMIHIFFGERAASKISDVPKDTKYGY